MSATFELSYIFDIKTCRLQQLLLESERYKKPIEIRAKKVSTPPETFFVPILKYIGLR